MSIVRIVRWSITGTNPTPTSSSARRSTCAARLCTRKSAVIRVITASRSAPCPIAPSFSSPKRHPLRQRQLRPPIDRRGLTTHVGLPGIGPRFAPAPGGLLSTEGSADLRPGGPDVDIGNAAITSSRSQECFAVPEMGGEQSRRQALRYGILQPDCLVQGPIGHHVEDRGKRLSLHDVPVVLRPHDRRLDEVAGTSKRLPPTQHITAFFLDLLKGRSVTRYRLLVDQRPHQHSRLK